MQLSISEYYSVTSYAPFPSYCVLFVKVLLSTGVPLSNTLIRGKLLKLPTAKFGIKKLDTRTALSYGVKDISIF